MTRFAPPVAELRVHGELLCGLTYFRDLLWFSDAALQQIQAIDPASGAVRQQIACPQVRTGLTALDGKLLQIVGPDASTKRLRTIDPDTGDVLDEKPDPRPGSELCGLEASTGAVWFGYANPRVIDRRFRSSFALRDSIPVERKIAGLTVVGERVAFADHLERKVVLVDPAAKQTVCTIDVAGNPTGLTWDGALLWYCDYTHVRLRAIEVPVIP